MTELNSLLEQLRSDLAEDALTADLAEQVPAAHDTSPARVAFVGPYNAGKSTIMSALTGDLSISRDAKPETDTVAYYPWRGLQLVDVPGWFSGFEQHDATADEELRRNADLVAFTLTVELGDENVQKALGRVLGDLGFAGRSVVLVNKTNAEDSNRSIILGEVMKRLGEFRDTPIIQTDAQDFIDTISGQFDLDPRDVEMLRADSGIEGLEDAILALVTANEDARSVAQRLQAKRVISEAVRRLVPDREEKAGVALVASLQRAAEACRERLTKTLDAERGRLTEELSELASGVLAAQQEGTSEGESHTHAAAEWALLSSASVERLNAALERELDQLARDTETSLNVVPLAELRSPPNPRTSDATSPDPGLLRRMFAAIDLKPGHVLDPLAQEAERLVKAGKGKDSIAYDLARKLQPNKVFKPYERLKEAEKIQKGAKQVRRGAKALPAALPAILEGANWWKDRRASADQKERAKRIRADYATAASEAADELASAFDAWLADALVPLDLKLRAMNAPLLELQKLRHAKLARYSALDQRIFPPARLLQ